MFNAHKKVSRTHFNIILPLPSKLWIYDTIFCNMLSASPVSAARCFIQPWWQIQQCRMLQMLRSSSFGGRLQGQAWNILLRKFC
jgi:hypothetical protein